ncbi:ATP synthase subunit I [Marivita sp. GX14005]|uniref:N-ATPase subunit AtpR n=1 Tax=Marivita sp. GX14005 TaxID=2942276 RepID=UPI002018EDE0|nr:ATP synthase subunit I [Marivita sp. GX14005]MCL3882938.1 ATP synthase subunit AtpR [Marivita sp. GX14005]
MALDWTALALGAAAGGLAAMLFFGGLAVGLRLALRSARPGAVLFASAALRLAALLGAGWLVALQGAPMLGGFMAGFLAARLLILLIARRRLPASTERAPCN